MQPKLVRTRPSLLVPPNVKQAVAAQRKTAVADGYVETQLGRYKKAQWSGNNESGITPWGDRILVLADEPAGKSGGGVIFTDEQQDKTGQAAETGVLVGIGNEAFVWNSDRSRRYEGPKPTLGQRIYFERYAGGFYKGRDGKFYRLMDDKCLGGLEA